MSNVLAEQESFSCFFYDQKVMSLTKWSLARNQNKVPLYDCDHSNNQSTNTIFNIITYTHPFCTFN